MNSACLLRLSYSAPYRVGPFMVLSCRSRSILEKWESNPWPSDLYSYALPTELSGQLDDPICQYNPRYCFRPTGIFLRMLYTLSWDAWLWLFYMYFTVFHSIFFFKIKKKMKWETHFPFDEWCTFLLKY